MGDPVDVELPAVLRVPEVADVEAGQDLKNSHRHHFCLFFYHFNKLKLLACWMPTIKMSSRTSSVLDTMRMSDLNVRGTALKYLALKNMDYPLEGLYDVMY